MSLEGVDICLPHVAKSENPRGTIVCLGLLSGLLSVLDEYQRDISTTINKNLTEYDKKSMPSPLSENSILDILKIRPNIQRCVSSESLTKAKQIFKGRDISYIVVEDKDTLVGIIAKAHRHY